MPEAWRCKTPMSGAILASFDFMMYQQDASCPDTISADLLLKEVVVEPEFWQLLLLPLGKPR